MTEPELMIGDLFSRRDVVSGNTARQLIRGASPGGLVSDEGNWFIALPDGARYRLRVRGETPVEEDGFELARDLFNALAAPFPEGELRWTTSRRPTSPDDVLEALRGKFQLKVAGADGGAGLRIPQAGALHAILAHWSTNSTTPGTVVLPTGTGKTETMLALFASERLRRVLVLVPSERLRVQIAEKFESYGILPAAGVVDQPVLAPVVGRIEHHFDSVASARSFADRCNVIVATPNALNASSPEIVAALTARCTHLFVDEAHHVPARTWTRVRDEFAGKPVIQFTATPYREDGQRLGGQVIYSFPLARARELDYFRPIKYISVLALAEPDRAVAQAAIDQLREDREAALDHLIMVRVNRIGRARDEVMPIYEELASEFSPQLLHSGLPRPERDASLAALRDRSSRIIVCVDMLGEGFDFPELKVAAIHDPHRSLGVTLQFIGRFARSRPDLGDATAVVARPEPGYDERLRALYAEDSQWNAVIETLSGDAIEQVRELDEFEGGFSGSDEESISLQILRPKMSAVVYTTACEQWRPEELGAIFPKDRIVSPLKINHDERVAWLVVEARTSVRWAQLQSLQDVAHHLHVMHWDQERGLLYINTSQLESLHEDLAQAVCGPGVERVDGGAVYRVLGELQRPVPTNVGVIDLRNRSRRFSMHVGADVFEGFPVADQQSKSNTNIFVVAYDRGDRVTLGAARKGRIWSQQAASSVLHWVRWCRRLGPKLQDESIVLDGLFRSFVRPEPLDGRPTLRPLAIDWPWMAYAGMGDSVKLQVDGAEGLVIDADLMLTSHEESGPLTLVVQLSESSAAYEVNVQDGALIYRAVGPEAQMLRERSEPEPLSSYLNREGTIVWFEQEVVVEGGVLYRLNREQPSIDVAKAQPISWAGVNIRRESQGPGRDPATVQARAAERLVTLEDWDVVLDDDDSGEIADLVALKEEHDRVIVHLVHCKFSSESDPGARLEDLYEVCGQTHRSAHHRQNVAAMVSNLIRRERKRRTGGRTGLLVGDDPALMELQEVVRRCRPEFRITIAQPGLSKAAARDRHLILLGVTDKYVSEIAHGTFDIWCSE